MIWIGHMIVSVHFLKSFFSDLFIPKRPRKFLTFILIVFSAYANAQVSTLYTWTYATSAHVVMAGGTTLASGTAMDDAVFTNIPIGFTFNFNGIDYTSVGVSTNGFIWFGNTNPATTEYNPLSSATAMTGVASVFGANMIGKAAASTLKYNTTGTCPNRVFMVQWFNMKVVGKTSQIDLQLTLTEGSNQVEVHPYDSPYFVADKFTGQVGLRGATNADFKNRSVISCTNLWNSSVAGGTNAATCQIDGVTCSTYPAANARYRFANSSVVTAVAWNGSVDNDWFNASNWTPAIVPTSYNHITIPTGLGNYPVLTGSTSAFCRNLTLSAGASLQTAAGYSGTLTVSGSIANDGAIVNSGNNYIVITGTSGTALGGAGDFTATDLSLVGTCASYVMGNTILIRKVNINTGAALSMNTFNLTVVSVFTQTGTLNQSTGVLQIEDPAATLTNATFNENTGTTYFAIGTLTSPGNQLIPSITYYNLKINTNNGFTASIGNGSTTTCSSLNISNPAASGGIASAVNAIAVNGNFDLAPTGNTPVVNLSANVTVTGIMTLYLGVINTGANKVIMNNSAATAVVAGGSNTNYSLSYINGNLRRMILSAAVADYDFPMGDGSGPHYIIMKDNGLSGGGFTYLDAVFSPLTNHTDASMIATEPSEAGVVYDHICTEGVWFLDPDNQPAAGGYDIEAFINGFSGLNDDLFAVLKRISASVTGADWYNGGASATRPASMQPGRTLASGYAYRSGLSSFSQFGIATHAPVVPMPVELLSFTGKNNGKENLLEWTTASEKNNDYFTLERSDHSLSFLEIAIVDGAGNSTEILNYSKADKEPLNGVSYYRLKQTDFDGNYSYSNIVALERNNADDFDVVNIYNAAVTGQIEITLSCGNTCETYIELYDVSGRKVYASMENQGEANSKIIIPTGAFSKGMYLLKAINGDKTISKKIIL